MFSRASRLGDDSVQRYLTFGTCFDSNAVKLQSLTPPLARCVRSAWPVLAWEFALTGMETATQGDLARAAGLCSGWLPAPARLEPPRARRLIPGRGWTPDPRPRMSYGWVTVTSDTCNTAGNCESTGVNPEPPVCVWMSMNIGLCGMR